MTIEYSNIPRLDLAVFCVLAYIFFSALHTYRRNAQRKTPRRVVSCGDQIDKRGCTAYRRGAVPFLMEKK